MTDIQRARLKMRCNHRGMKEMDIIMGKFADADFPDMDGPALSRLEDMLEENDQDLLSWIIGRETPPEKHEDLIGVLRQFHGI